MGALLPQIKTALGERVCIRGRVRYRRDGVPATVDAQWLRILRALAHLPSIDEMIGITGASDIVPLIGTCLLYTSPSPRDS